MDGNGRWAKQRHHPRTFGHIAGVKGAKSIMLAARDCGVAFLTLYTFSMENWGRPPTEVSFLMQLIERYFKKERDFLIQEGVRVCGMGDLSPVPSATQRMIHETEKLTEHNRAIQVNLAFSYSGRKEILDACAKACKALPPEQEEELASYLYLPDIPDPELLIRTGGEQRLSNFMLWQIAYTELYFTDTLWPDFTPEKFKEALVWYAGRIRKFGKVIPEVTQDLP